MKVSRWSVNAADNVKKQGVPQLVDALAAGKVSVSATARIAAASNLSAGPLSTWAWP